jgi:hypothetical protein
MTTPFNQQPYGGAPPPTTPGQKTIFGGVGSAPTVMKSALSDEELEKKVKKEQEKEEKGMLARFKKIFKKEAE